MGQPHGIGIVGLGNISRAYLDTLIDVSDVKIVAVADLDASRARAVAEQTRARAVTVGELVNDPAVRTVLNLTIPAAHADVALAAITAGKDVYNEKPLAATLADAQRIIAAAAEAGTRVGCAPDTVLGTGIQTARAAVDTGLIGRPIAARAIWGAPGHERWHPHPDFYYQPGGGPLLDMGPYYVASLLQLLGPVVRVTGMSSRGRDERTIARGPRAGESIDVQIDTHVTGILEHATGVVSTLTTSFDTMHTTGAPIEVHGVEGTLALPDPNTFTGQSRLWTDGHGEGDVLPVTAGFADGARGVGLLDFVRSRPREGRVSGALALHTLEVMEAILTASDDGESRIVSSSFERPDLVPLTARSDWQKPQLRNAVPDNPRSTYLSA